MANKHNCDKTRLRLCHICNENVVFDDYYSHMLTHKKPKPAFDMENVVEYSSIKKPKLAFDMEKSREYIPTKSHRVDPADGHLQPKFDYYMKQFNLAGPEAEYQQAANQRGNPTLISSWLKEGKTNQNVHRSENMFEKAKAIQQARIHAVENRAYDSNPSSIEKRKLAYGMYAKDFDPYPDYEPVTNSMSYVESDGQRFSPDSSLKSSNPHNKSKLFGNNEEFGTDSKKSPSNYAEPVSQYRQYQRDLKNINRKEEFGTDSKKSPSTYTEPISQYRQYQRDLKNINRRHSFNVSKDYRPSTQSEWK
jgi:hypothetical protein